MDTIYLKENEKRGVLLFLLQIDKRCNEGVNKDLIQLSRMDGEYTNVFSPQKQKFTVTKDDKQHLQGDELSLNF